MALLKKILIIIGILFLGVVVLSVLTEDTSPSPPINFDNGQITPGLQPEFTGNWIKYSANPVLREQSSSHWFQWAGDPFVLKDGNTYKMWFGANKKDSITNIGYATSIDGINWNLHSEPVLEIGKDGEWDDYTTETPMVIKNSDGAYEMWYTGSGGAPEDESAGFDRLHKIGYATSIDGINWIKYPKIVLDVEIDNPSDWEKWDFAGKADPMVIKENGVYKMWYSGAGSNDQGHNPIQIGYATSTDGINWMKNKNPVLSFGNSWDKGSVAIPSVFFNGEKYIMLYTGKDDAGKGNEEGTIGCAISNEGLNWKRISNNQCIKKGNGADFDNYGLWGATGLYEDGGYKVWYGGLKVSDDVHVSVGYAFIE